MKNQFLFDNAISLSIGTILFVLIYLALLIRICNSVIIKRPINDYNNADRIKMSSIIFSFLLNLSLIIDPIYQVLHQFKYSLYNTDFTIQIITKSISFVVIATLYSIISVIVVNLVGKMSYKKNDSKLDEEENLGEGIFYALFLIGVTLVFKEHLSVLLDSVIQDGTVPVFN